MPDVIVHIGFHKCGSTAIQKWLTDNQRALARHGYAYRRTDPRPWEICSNPQFLDLAFSLAGRPLPPRPMTDVLGYEAGDLAAQQKMTDSFAAEYDRWLDGIGDRTVLISNEFLAPWLLKEDVISAFDAWLSERFKNVRYVAYIRAPMPWFISLHGHQARLNATGESLEAFISRLGKPPFARQLKTWDRVISQDRLDVRLFQEDWLSSDGLIDDFSAAIGLTPGVIRSDVPRVNTSFAPHKRGMFRLPSKNAPKRPQPAAALCEKVGRETAQDVQWIGEQFFAAQPEDYVDWAMR